MKWKKIIVILVILPIASCCPDIIRNKIHEDIEFSKIDSGYQLTDSNNFGCDKADSSVFINILKTGTLISEKDVHDYYSTTGCSTTGSIFINGVKANFTFEYGGIIYFSDGKILGCGKKCCTEKFLYCSYDPENLKG